MRKFLMIVMIATMALACQEEQLITEKSSVDLLIKTGTICGWCTMDDTLSISSNTVKYVNYTQCNNSTPAVEREGEISSEELDALLALLDFNEFKKIDLNTCNVCFDGCDTWLFIQKGTETHQIRFTGNEPQLQPVKPFIDRLNTIKTSNQ